jgi:hypothetical protein
LLTIPLGSVNIAAQIANNSVQLHMVSAEVHPKMTPDGRYPREFDLPKRLEQVLSADGKSFTSHLPSLHFLLAN